MDLPFYKNIMLFAKIKQNFIICNPNFLIKKFLEFSPDFT